MVGMKFGKLVFIYIILQVLFIPFTGAEEAPAAGSPITDDVQKVKADLDAQYESWVEERRKKYAPRWDENIEELSVRANKLLVENQRLEAEQQILADEWKSVEAEIVRQKQTKVDLQQKIDSRQSADDRDQEPPVDDLKKWQKKLDDNTKELEEYNRRLVSLDKKIKLGELKLASLGVDYKQIDQRLKAEQEIEALRFQISEAKDRERVLQDKSARLKTSGALDPKVAEVRDEIERLKVQISEAQSPRAKKVPEDHQTEMAGLMAQKESLQKDIDRLEASVGKIEKAQTMGIAHQRTKAIVDEMSTVNTDNDRLKEEMDVLKENIEILKSHVKKLEYQADRVNSMKGNMGQMKDLNNPF